MSLYIVSHQEALLSLNEMVDLQVENPQGNDAISILSYLLAFLEDIKSRSVAKYALVPHPGLVVAPT